MCHARKRWINLFIKQIWNHEQRMSDLSVNLKKWLITAAKLKHLPLHNELEKLNTRSFQNGARSYKDAKQGYDYIERNGVYLDNIWSSLCGHIDHNWCYFIAVLYKFISASASHEQKNQRSIFIQFAPLEAVICL